MCHHLIVRFVCAKVTLLLITCKHHYIKGVAKSCSIEYFFILLPKITICDRETLRYRPVVRESRTSFINYKQTYNHDIYRT